MEGIGDDRPMCSGHSGGFDVCSGDYSRDSGRDSSGGNDNNGVDNKEWDWDCFG